MNMLRTATSLLLLSSCGFAANGVSSQVDSVYPQVEALYEDLHRNPELSMQETQTAAKIAERLRRLGYEVTTGVGGTGVVAVLKNGAGPAVLLRTELDALPVEEQTGLPYASHVHAKNDVGADVGVMHACGHDIHMASLVGTATIMAQDRQSWHGTLMLLAQPAEEVGRGAAAMIKDGLLTRFPRPDFAFAMHDSNGEPAGKVSYTPGFSLTSADSVDITIFGKGGHGAHPSTAIDPIVIAARTVLALQTIVSREVDPHSPAIITVGSIHGGTKHNIIPGEVKLQLTVRAYDPAVRRHLLEAIARIAKYESLAGNAPREPEVKVSDSTPPNYNDPQLTSRIAEALKKQMGTDNVVEAEAGTASDDFALLHENGITATMFGVGAADPQKFAEAQKTGVPLPSNHSPLFAPDREPTLKTAMMAEVIALRELLR
jgi:amidohydrolase